MSLNEKEGNLEKVAPAAQKKANYSGSSYQGPAGRWTGPSWNGYGGQANSQTEESSSLGPSTTVTLLKPPAELRELEMLWTLVLESQGDTVAPQAIDFLIKVHLSLSHDLKPQRTEILQAFVSRCMQILTEEKSRDHQKCTRVINILKRLIHATEVKGTAGVQPHGAL